MANLVQPVRTLSTTARCCSIAVYLLNLLYALGSIGMVMLSTWVLSENMSGDIALLFDSETYRHASFTLIFSGLVVVVLAICGCCSTRKENSCCLKAYLIALTVMFVVEIIGGVMALSFYTQGTNDLERVMLETIQRGYGIGGNEHANDDNTFAWNNVQEQYDCCGVFEGNTGPLIYLRSHWFRDQPVISRAKVPLSCCKEGDNEEPTNAQHCQDPNTDYTHVYKTGCYDAVKLQGDKYTIPLAAVGISHSFLVLISLIIAYFYYRKLTEDD